MELEETEEVATNRAKELGPFIAKRHKSGSTYDEIAVQMNKTKIPAPIGKSKWDGPMAREYHIRATVAAGVVKRVRVRRKTPEELARDLSKPRR